MIDHFAGLKEEDIKRVAQFIHEGVELALEAKAACTGTLLKEFKDKLEAEPFRSKLEVKRKEVEAYANKFFMPGLADM